MIIYKILVRDKIPDIIHANGGKCDFIIIDQASFILELRKKLQEKVCEYLTSSADENALEELADILEAVHSLASPHHSNIEEIENMRHRKLEERCGFNEIYFLINKK